MSEKKRQRTQSIKDYLIVNKKRVFSCSNEEKTKAQGGGEASSASSSYSSIKRQKKHNGKEQKTKENVVLKWERPRIPLPKYQSELGEDDEVKKKLQEKEYPLAFMMMDVTYEMTENAGVPHVLGQISKKKHKRVPTIICTGVNENGETVTANVHGFMPYFYCDSGILCRLFERKSEFTKEEFEEAKLYWTNRVHERLEQCVKQLSKKSKKSSSSSGKGANHNHNGDGNDDEDEVGERVHRVTITHKKPLYALQLSKRPMFKIEMCQPFDVPLARRSIWDNQWLRDVRYGACHQCYEPNVEFVIRWMIDSRVTGCGWMSPREEKDAHVVHHYIKNPCNKRKKAYYGGGDNTASPLPEHIYDQEEKRKRSIGRNTTTDIEYHVNYEDFIGLDPAENPRWKRVAPFVVMSYDIEVKAARIGEFPKADKAACQVIDIGCLIQVYGQRERHKLITFCLDDCDPPETPKRDGTRDPLIPPPEVYSFDSEEDMLIAWSKCKMDMQTDMTTGYNTYGFDTKYLYDRAKYLGISKQFGRNTTKFPSRVVTLKKAGFTNKQKGSNTFELPTKFGDIEIDTLKCATGDVFLKLRSYKLDNVAEKLLKRNKVDVHYSEINGLHETNSSTRKRLVEYVNEDAILPLEILENRGYLPALIEQARVCHIPLQWMITKGQQVRNIAAFLPFCVQEDFVLPYIKVPYQMVSNGGGGGGEEDDDDEGYQGATVLQPTKGYYDECVLVLDFASLYPSIMQWMNLCYSTWIPHDSPMLKYMVEGVHYTVGPTGHAFVNKQVFHGVLPRALRDILRARSMAKKDMAKAEKAYGKTSAEYKKEDSRQAALKVTANSMYGLTGAVVGRLPCKPVAETVTAYGRLLIEITKKYVEEQDPSYQVVYGDTDSVMVRINGCKDISKALQIGKHLEKKLNDELFTHPIEIELENGYYPWILIGKKMYTGPLWTSGKGPSGIKSRGLTNVRRDNALFASELYNQVIQTFFAWDQKAMGGKGDLIDVVKNPQSGEIIRHGWNRQTMQLEGDNVQATIDLIHTRMKQLHAGEIPLEKLIISQSFGRPIERYKSKLPHIELVKTMRKRDPASAPKIGERVPYVVVKGIKGDNLCDHVEDPRYAKNHNIPIDYDYYDDTQCKKPLLRLLTPVFAKQLNVHFNDVDYDEDEFEKEDGMDKEDKGCSSSSSLKKTKKQKGSWLKTIEKKIENNDKNFSSNGGTTITTTTTTTISETPSLTIWDKMMKSSERAPDPHVEAYKRLFPKITKKKMHGPSEHSVFSIFRKDIQEKRGISCINPFQTLNDNGSFESDENESFIQEVLSYL